MHVSEFLPAITLEQLFHRITFHGRFQQYLGGNNDVPFFLEKIRFSLIT